MNTLSFQPPPSDANHCLHSSPPYTPSTRFLTAPSSPAGEANHFPATQMPNLSVFQTDWKGFVEDRKPEARAEAHVASDSDFEFDAAASDMEGLPLSPTLISPAPCSDGVQFQRQQVPVLHRPPRRRFPPALSVRQLMAAELSDDARSCCSSPQTPPLKRGSQEFGTLAEAGLSEDSAESKSSDVIRRKKKSNSSKGAEDEQSASNRHAPQRSPRVHHTDDDQDRHSSGSFDVMSREPSSVDEEPASSNGKGDIWKHCKKWAFKDLLKKKNRSGGSSTTSDEAERPRRSVEGYGKPLPPGRSPVARSARLMSPHEAHYKMQRAQMEEVRKKTTLPYRPSLLSCLGGALFANSNLHNQVC